MVLTHYLMNEDNQGRVSSFLGTHLAILNFSAYRDANSGVQGMDQSKNIKAYSAYLEERVLAYRDFGYDIFREYDLSDGKRLSKEWDRLQTQIPSIDRMIKRILDTKFFVDICDNAIAIEAVRLMVLDLMKLFQILNDAIGVMLKQFFTFEKKEASRAMSHYKAFVDVTDKVKEYFVSAKKLPYGVSVSIPEIKHVPLSLLKSLQEYVESPDFEKERQSRTSENVLESHSSHSQKPLERAHKQASTADMKKLNQSAASSASYSIKENVIDGFSFSQAPRSISRESSVSSFQDQSSSGAQSSFSSAKQKQPTSSNLKNMASDLVDLDFTASPGPKMVETPMMVTANSTLSTGPLSAVSQSAQQNPQYAQQQKLQELQQLAAANYQMIMQQQMLQGGGKVSGSPMMTNLNGLNNNMQLGYGLSPMMPQMGALSQPSMMPSQFGMSPLMSNNLMFNANKSVPAPSNMPISAQLQQMPSLSMQSQQPMQGQMNGMGMSNYSFSSASGFGMNAMRPANNADIKNVTPQLLPANSFQGMQSMQMQPQTSQQQPSQMFGATTPNLNQSGLNNNNMGSLL